MFSPSLLIYYFSFLSVFLVNGVVCDTSSLQKLYCPTLIDHVLNSVSI